MNIGKQKERDYSDKVKDHTVECAEVFWETLKPLVSVKILLCDIHRLQKGVFSVGYYFSWHGKVEEHVFQVLTTHVIDEKRLSHFKRAAELSATHLNKWVEEASE